MEARREWDEIFKVLKEKAHQTRILYPVKLFFQSKGENTEFLRQTKNKRLCCKSICPVRC